MSVTGFAGQGPMRAGAAVADVTAGLQAALGIMTAIVERETTGEGQWVQSNLLQAGLTLLDFQAARYTMDGQVPPQVGNDHPTSMPTSAYRTADGFINVAASGSAIWKRLCDAIGRPDLLSDPRFASAQGRATHRTALAEEINAVLASRPSLEWVESLNAAGVPCGPIHAMDEVFADAQVRHLNAAVAVEHPTLGTLNILNQAIKLSRTPGAVVTATPERGEHSDEILGEIGLSAAQVAELRASGAIR
jgi:formyl-CoA transferase